MPLAALFRIIGYCSIGNEYAKNRDPTNLTVWKVPAEKKRAVMRVLYNHYLCTYRLLA